MSTVDVEALKVLLEKATPGPWAVHDEKMSRGNSLFFGQPGPGKDHTIGHVYKVSRPHKAALNAALIVALRNSAEDLISAEERAQKAEGENARLRGVVALGDMRASYDDLLELHRLTLRDLRAAEAERDALKAEVERLQALVSQSEAERYRTCAELQAQLTASQAACGELSAGIKAAADQLEGCAQALEARFPEPRYGQETARQLYKWAEFCRALLTSTREG